MGMPGALLHYTVEMVQGLPDDGNRHEAVYGELLVTPAPRKSHQRVVLRLSLALQPYVETWNLGELFGSPLDLVHGPDSVVEPDVMVLRPGVEDVDLTDLSAALLVVEVLSPSTARQDRFTKRRLYQESGVPAYWIVDPDARVVEVWTPEAAFPVIVLDVVRWHPSGAGEPFELELAELFRPPSA
jgi:Uma2 family endonuclease